MQASPKNIIAALLTGCFFLCSCENDERVVNAINKPKLNTEQAKDIVLNYTMGGRIKAILTSPLMLHVQDTAAYYEFPKTLYAEFYNEQQIKESQLTALYGKYKDGQSIIYLRDSVRIINLLKGDTIYCDDLWWDRNKINTEFYTEKPVRIRQKDGQYLNGTGMEASQSFKNYHIKNMKPADNKPIGVINTKAGDFPQ